MKEIRAIVKVYQQTNFSKTKAALATIERVEGLPNRRTGARMLNIGLLGPAKRAKKMIDELGLIGKTLSGQSMQKLFAPARLDIRADCPDEIALSIVGEIQLHFKKRQGLSLRHKEGTIHEP